ncbi:Protein of unknown function [Pyronema omphalodes CBS 100304]|uniref:Uncharacterized protein n=1 Tax=Pyronema omphalodes (strain CBS 100304) TaxID=1076935 RepID=U4KWW4_PYROM|nr:Protein of unknown function [Pyronema omphalodes CBS 100304]
MLSIGRIVRFSNPWKTELEQAFQSRAVCVLVKFEKGEVVAPTALRGLKNWEVGTILRPELNYVYGSILGQYQNTRNPNRLEGASMQDG